MQLIIRLKWINQLCAKIKIKKQTYIKNKMTKQMNPNPTFSDNCNPESYPRKKIQHFSYFLNDTIGKGYSSTVYRGRNDHTNEPVAVKVIDMKMLKNEVHQTLLISEIGCLKKLKRCPYIIELFEVYTTKNNTYLITQLCQNGDLNSMVGKKKINEKQAIILMQQIIKGYLQVFKKGILHRDLKPANILLNGSNLKIADFGFSIKIEDNKKNSSYNVGSPLYMPPQTLLENKYSFKSDIWALGIIFFQILTGKAPWKARTEKQLANKILNSKIKDLLPAQLSASSVDFLTKTLNPNIIFRMSPEQLQNFSFVDSLSNARKIDSKHQSLIRSERKVSSINSQKPKPNTTLPSITNEHVQTQKNDTINKKQLSKQVLSYVHFCRFLYKLITRIQCCNIQNTQRLKQQFTSLIYYKINLLSTLQKHNVFQIQNYKQFKQTVDCKKIINIIKQYEIKYKESLAKYKYGCAFQDYKIILKEINQIINQIYINIEQTIQLCDVSNCQQQIILLDYLITTYQLINLDNTKDIKQFSKKSKIEAIVEGTTNSVTYSHFKAIKQKMHALNFI